MGLELDPAALGGLAGLIALASWAVGRMQGGWRAGRDAPPQAPQAPSGSAAAAPSPLRDPEPEPAPVCRQRAFEERRALHAAPVSLADLHAEAAAIRRDARIFAQGGGDALALPDRQGLGDCRYLGLSGQPTCPAPLACASCGEAAAADQLSAEPASLTRV